jgi:hypothetical protein
MDAIVIYGFKVGDDYYITAQKNGYNHPDLKRYFFDGSKPRPSFDQHWSIIDKAPSVIIEKKPQPDINHRYVLIDDTLISDARPEVLMRDEACYRASCGDWVWKEEYAQYKSLYTLISDKQPIVDEPIPFEWQELGEVEPFNEPTDYNYPVGKVWRSYSSKHEDDYVRRAKIQHQDIDRAIFPSFLIHTKPCKISQKDAYAIIREHVKLNIDPKYARVSSDYDFSFQVMKKITLAKPFESTKTYKPIGKRKNITQKIMNTVKEQPVFSMEDRKGVWLNVPEFEGKDEDELKGCIDMYLEQLMVEINEPIVECPKCCGTGVKGAAH